MGGKGRSESALEDKLVQRATAEVWWHSIRRRSQKHRINWTPMLILAKRWLPPPAVLHPFPDARFAATHPR